MERQILSGFCFKDACQLQWSISVSSSRLECSVESFPLFLLRGPLQKSCSPSSSTTRWSVLCLAFKTFFFFISDQDILWGEKCSSGNLWLFKSSAFRMRLFSIQNTQIIPWKFWSKSKLMLRMASHTSWQRSRTMLLLYRSEKTVPTCVYWTSSPLFYLLHWKNAEFANLSQVKGKNIEGSMCHTDFREALALNLVPVISGSWPISGAGMGSWDEWQTCHLKS